MLANSMLVKIVNEPEGAAMCTHQSVVRDST